VTGLGSNLESAEQSAFPNPFGSEGMKISFKGGFHYQITDIKGAVLEEGNGRENAVLGAELKSGNYLLLIEDEKGKYVQKIVKQ
jgi:hypothetical protein